MNEKQEEAEEQAVAAIRAEAAWMAERIGNLLEESGARCNKMLGMGAPNSAELAHVGHIAMLLAQARFHAAVNEHTLQIEDAAAAFLQSRVAQAVEARARAEDKEKPRIVVPGRRS